MSESAVLAANYLRGRLRKTFDLPFDAPCMPEFVLSARKLKETRGVRAMDVAKRLLDYGFYAPTVYFPLIVEEALMIEPTETESIETLDEFIAAMRQIDDEIKSDPDFVRHAPHTTEYKRLDEVAANRNLNLRWTPENAPAVEKVAAD